ncbi:unnamed protein product, partial [marine sediment metagenome]
MSLPKQFSVGILLIIFITIIFSLLTNSEFKQKIIKSNPERNSDLRAQITNIQIPFIINKGQMDEEIVAYAQTFGGTAFITDRADIIYSLKNNYQTDKPMVLKECLVYGNPIDITFEEKSATRISVFKGNDPSKWVNNTHSYKTVSFGEAYDGIEVKLKAYANNIEKLFYVSPGADPGKIGLTIEGTNNLVINDDGELIANTESGQIAFTRPIAYQNIDNKRTKVEVAYCLDENNYGFIVGDYDRGHTLIIDPFLASTYLGGSGIDGWEYTGVIDNTIDNDGFPLVAGMTESIDFPSMEGQYECETRGNIDLFVARFNQDLTELLAVTVIGGGGDEEQPRIKIGVDGSIYLSSRTHSSNYPTTAGTIGQTYAGNGDVVISK